MQLPPHKEQQWADAVQEFTRTVDGIGRHLDKGIFETVVVLNLLGITTKASCEGHLDHGVAAPWVDIAALNVRAEYVALIEAIKERDKQVEMQQLSRSEKAALYKRVRECDDALTRKHLPIYKLALEQLDAFYAQRTVPYDRLLILQNYADSVRLQSQGALFQIADILGDRAEKLKEYQEEMQAFTDFLKRVWAKL